MTSLRLQREYEKFKASLEPLLESAERSKDLDPDLQAVLDVLDQWKEKKARLRRELQVDEGPTETATEVEKVEEAIFKVDMTTIDGALQVLVHAAVQDLGPVARDVFAAIFWPTSHPPEWDQAVAGVTYADLKELCKIFQRDTVLAQQTISHHIIAVDPVAPAGEPKYAYRRNKDQWTIDYRSVPIACKMSEKLEKEEYEQLFDWFRSFRNYSQSSALAGWVHEHIANRKLRTDARKDLVLVKMRGDLSVNAPILDVDFDEDVPEVYLHLPGGDRELMYFQSREFAKLTEEAYYVPERSNFPLFDSFLVERGAPESSKVLWVFQMSTSSRHGGSREGYVSIRDIIRSLKRTFGAPETTGKVKMDKYYLRTGTDRQRREDNGESWI